MLRSSLTIAISLLCVAFAAPTLARSKVTAGAPLAAKPAALPVPAHFHNSADVRVELVFVAPQGNASVDEKGVRYQVGESRPFRGTVRYPQPFWRDGYAVFVGGQAVKFQVKIHNLSGKPMRDVQVVAALEHLNFFAKDGEDLPGSPVAGFFVDAIPARGVWQAEGSVVLPLGLPAGLQQVHVQVQRPARKDAKLLYSDAQAGLYFPPELMPSGT